MRFNKLFLLVVSLIFVMFVSVSLSQSQSVPESLSFPFNNASGEWKVAGSGGYNNGDYHGTKSPYAQYALDLERENGGTEGQYIHAPTNAFYVRQQGTRDCVDLAIAEYDDTHWLWLEICHIDLESYIPQGVYQQNVVVKGEVIGQISSSICFPAGRCPIPHVHIAAHVSPKYNPFNYGIRLPMPFSITTWDLRLDGHDFPVSSDHDGESDLVSFLPAQCVEPPTVDYSPLVFVQSLAQYSNVCGYTEQYVGGSDAVPAPIVETGPNWLQEFSKVDRVLVVDFHTLVDASSGDYSAHRVLVDGQNIGETSAAEQYFTWNTYGWADGYHTLRVEYRRVSDNGDWANALSFEENFYLSPNRTGTAPCGTQVDGVQFTSGSDCIVITQDYGDLAPIGWADRSDVQACVSGQDLVAWLYDGVVEHDNYQGSPYVISDGQCGGVGSNISSVDLRTTQEVFPNPGLPFEADANTTHLYHFDEDSGNTLMDSVGGLNGNISSGNWVTGPFGSALGFTNPTDGRAVTFAPLDLCSFTAEMWVKEDVAGSGRIAGQLGGNGNSGQNKWLMVLDNNKPKLEIWSGGGSQSITSYRSLILGQWHFVMVTYDCSSLVAKLYLDNELVGEFTTIATMNSGATNLEFGAAEGIGKCNCTLDEARISNVVRVPTVQIAPTTTPIPTDTPTVTPSATPSPTATDTPTETPIPGETIDSTGTGLTGYYFNGMNLSGDSSIRIDPVVDMDTSGSPHPFVGADNFSIRWLGLIEPQYSEQYEFCIVSDDGIRSNVAGELVVDNWTDHGPTENCGNVDLVAGMEYYIVVEFYENGGGATAQLYWSSASQPKEIVPQSQLYPAEIPQPTDTPMPTVTPEAGFNSGLVLNGSFEDQQADGWAVDWDADSPLISINTDNEGNNGENSLHFDANFTQSDIHTFSEWMFIGPNETYTWSAYVRSTSGSGEFGFYLSEFDSNEDWISGQWFGAIYGQEEGVYVFEYTPSSQNVVYAGLEYYMVGQTTFDAFVDSVSVFNNSAVPTDVPTVMPTATETETPVPTATEVLTFDSGLAPNGSFENLTDGWADNWNTSHTTISIDANTMGNHGAMSLHLSPSSVYSNVVSAGFAIDSNFSYEISFYVNSGGGNGQSGLIIDEYGPNWEYYQNQWTGPIFGDADGVITYTYTPTNSDVANISLQFYMNAGTEFDVYIDSVSVFESGYATSTPVPTETPTDTPVPTDTNVPTVDGGVSASIIDAQNLVVRITACVSGVDSGSYSLVDAGDGWYDNSTLVGPMCHDFDHTYGYDDTFTIQLVIPSQNGDVVRETEVVLVEPAAATPTETSVPTSTPTPTETFVPENEVVGMNIGSYCVNGLGAVSDGRVGEYARDWVCIFDGDVYQYVDMAALCVWQDGGSHPYAGLSDAYNWWSWSCNSQPQPAWPEGPQSPLP